MRFTRLYSTPDGESHFEDVDRAIEVSSVPDRKAGLIGVSEGVFFVRSAPHKTIGQHTTPQRQLMLVITGDVEYGASSGETRRFGPGSILLIEDTSGKGHTTKLGSEGDLALFIPLAEGVLQ